jgi:formate--tetrahydrofolate ligase
MLSDIEIAQAAQIRHIKEIAAQLQISNDDLEYYGKYKAKLPLHLIDTNKFSQSKLILVTAITPTPAGEGKTTVSVGLADGLNAIGKKTIAVLREPSLGPVFGMKGGAAGGGYSQVIPMEDINLHFTGDFSAIEKANNLLAALIDNNLQNPKRSLQLDPRTIVWKRVMDMNDRALRNIVIGLGGTTNGIPRQDGFNITPASEIMAILCLSENLEDLKKRLGAIYIGTTYDGNPVYARDLNATDALVVLLKEAIKPNLVQTLEGNPALIHGGPFASIAQGTNSVIATKMGLSLADYVVTEAGFAADLGAEKFFNIKCQSAGLNPSAVVIVVTLRALRHHGGAQKAEYSIPSPERVRVGLSNLEKHIENMKLFGFNPLIAINAFPNDTPEEIELVQQLCHKHDTRAVVSNGFAEGGKGAINLAESLVEQIENYPASFKPLYDNTMEVEEKIQRIATQIYGADRVQFSVKAKAQLEQFKRFGMGHLPVCMAKTPKSLSDDDQLRGRPTGFVVRVREFEVASGAGFLIPILGDMMRMPGLPSTPNAERITIDANGKISGLS